MVTITVGAKYDQRAQERYPAVNIQSVFRYRRLILLGEVYGKRELNFHNWQVAFNVQAGVLAVKRRLIDEMKQKKFEIGSAFLD